MRNRWRRRLRRSSWHGSDDLVRRYVRRDPLLAEDQVWALEAHLEFCGTCRQRLSSLVASELPQVTALLGEVWGSVDRRAADRMSAPARRGWVVGMARWASPAVTSWLAAIVLTLVVVLFADLVTPMAYPSLVTLLAPVVPVLGVALAWARGCDPAYELVVATPRAGLYLVLRRTVTVLVVTIPVLLLAGWVGHASVAVWLLPCLAFCVGTLAIGGVVGVSRAAIGLLAVWVMLVVGPSLVTSRLSFVLEPASRPGWVGVLLAGSVALMFVARSGAYVRLGSQR